MKLSISIYLIALGLISLSCNNKNQNSEIKKTPRTAKTFVISEYSQFAGRSFPALTKPARSVELSFRVSGVLNKLNAQEGQFVKKGEAIAALDPRDFQVKLKATKASYEQAKAEKQRFERLLKSNSIPKNDYEIKLAQFEQAKAQYESAKNANEDTRLLAPFDGYIGTKYTENYQEVQTKQPIVSLIDLSRIEIRFHIPENLVVKQEQFDSFQIQFENLPNIKFNASLKEIGKTAEAEGFPITLVLDHQIPEGSTIDNVSGLACRVIMNLTDQLEQSIVIPISAVFEERDSNKSAVWVLNKADNTVSKRYITLGHFISKNLIEVSDGLTLDEEIISAGVHFLNEGQKVRIMQ